MRKKSLVVQDKHKPVRDISREALVRISYAEGLDFFDKLIFSYLYITTNDGVGVRIPNVSKFADELQFWESWIRRSLKKLKSLELIFAEKKVITTTLPPQNSKIKTRYTPHRSINKDLAYKVLTDHLTTITFRFFFLWLYGHAGITGRISLNTNEIYKLFRLSDDAVYIAVNELYDYGCVELKRKHKKVWEIRLILDEFYAF